MPVTYVVKFQVVPGKYDAFLALLTLVLDEMRHESTFVEAVLHADPDDANRLMLYETWADHDDVVNVQLLRPYREAFHEALPRDARGAARHLDLALPARRPRYKMNLLRSVFFAGGATRSFAYLAST